RGCEIGSLLVVDRGLTNEAASANEVAGLMSWFSDAWRQADTYSSLNQAYESICRNRIRTRQIVPTEDDNRPRDVIAARGRGPLTEGQIRQLRTFDNFWIDAGALGANLGRGIPGNQLDMKRFTRAFFGAPIETLDPNTEIDQITLVWDGDVYPNRT